MSIANTKLKPAQLRQLVRCFCVDLTATQTALLSGLNRKTVNRYYALFRQAIHAYQVSQRQHLVGDIEIDESYFGPRRIKGLASKRGRGTHRQPVFGMYKRGGRVYTEIIPNCSRATLQAIIRGRIGADSVIYSDGWSGYDGLVDVGYDKHYRVKHHKDEFSNRNGTHINGIESFWSYTKRRLTRFNGVKQNFDLHLKECEWRWAKKPDQLERELYRLMV